MGKTLGKHCDKACAGEGINEPCWGGERLFLSPREPRKQKPGCKAHSFIGKAREIPVRSKGIE